VTFDAATASDTGVRRYFAGRASVPHRMGYWSSRTGCHERRRDAHDVSHVSRSGATLDRPSRRLDAPNHTPTRKPAAGDVSLVPIL